MNRQPQWKLGCSVIWVEGWCWSKLLRFSLDSELDHCGGTRRNTPLKTAKTARKRCSGNEEKELCIVSILLLIDTVRGNNWNNRWNIDWEKNRTQDRALWNTTRWRIKIFHSMFSVVHTSCYHTWCVLWYTPRAIIPGVCYPQTSHEISYLVCATPKHLMKYLH